MERAQDNTKAEWMLGRVSANARVEEKTLHTRCLDG